MDRKYLPTFSDLVDRLSIVQLKAIFIAENREAYQAEMRLIEHDINVILEDRNYVLTAADIRAVMVVMLANRWIWENESKARAGGDEQDKMLRATHSINGVRNTAKNLLAVAIGERLDLKVDCLAESLPKDLGNWQVFE